MTSRLIVPIVEGQGEQLALPILIRRIFGEFQPDITPVVADHPKCTTSGHFKVHHFWTEKQPPV